MVHSTAPSPFYIILTLILILTHAINKNRTRPVFSTHMAGRISSPITIKTNTLHPIHITVFRSHIPIPEIHYTVGYMTVIPASHTTTVLQVPEEFYARLLLPVILAPVSLEVTEVRLLFARLVNLGLVAVYEA